MRKESGNRSSDSDDPDQDAGESFLGRWSRRKQSARTDPEKLVPDKQSGSPERVLTDEDMPPLDSLDEDSDYKDFLSPGVSEELRTAALRKLFLSSKFNFVDGLDDYAEDFTKFEPLGDIITADMRHQMELAKERAKKALEEDVAASKEDGDLQTGEGGPVAGEDDNGVQTTLTDDGKNVDDEETEEHSNQPSGNETRHG